MARQLKTLLERGAFFEAPRWREGRWWVSDFYRHLVLTVTPDGAAKEILEQSRLEAREAVLLTTTVDVPHAGLP
jgi:hypothetical protein